MLIPLDFQLPPKCNTSLLWDRPHGSIPSTPYLLELVGLGSKRRAEGIHALVLLALQCHPRRYLPVGGGFKIERFCIRLRRDFFSHTTSRDTTNSRSCRGAYFYYKAGQLSKGAGGAGFRDRRVGRPILVPSVSSAASGSQEGYAWRYSPGSTSTPQVSRESKRAQDPRKGHGGSGVCTTYLDQRGRRRGERGVFPPERESKRAPIVTQSNRNPTYPAKAVTQAVPFDLTMIECK